MLFSNRRKPANSATKLEADLKDAAGCSSLHLRGAEEIDGWLRSSPNIVRTHGLDLLQTPIRLDPQELQEVINALHAAQTLAPQTASTRENFGAYPGIDRKNEINDLSERYFRSVIQQQSEPYFAALKEFLENPRNRTLAGRYHEAASEFQSKAMTYRDRFTNFETVFDQFCELICTSSPSLQSVGKKRLVRLVLHYMYCDCDFGENAPNDSP